MRILDASMNTRTGMYKALAAAMDKPPSLSTFKRWFPRLMSANKCKTLLASAKDHSFCPTCAHLTSIFYDSWPIYKASQSTTAPAATAAAGPAAQKRAASAVQALRLHKARDVACRAFRHTVAGIGRMIDNRDATVKGCIYGLAKRAGVYMVHADDAAGFQLPHFEKDAQCPRARYNYQLHGEAEEISGICTAYIPELGGGSKDANMVVNLLLINLIAHCQGKQVFMPYLDNAALQKCGSVALALPQFLVDAGACLFCCPVFGIQSHCKGRWDAFFQCALSLLNCCVLGTNYFGTQIRGIKSAGNDKMRAYRVNPFSFVSWTQFFCARYNVFAPKKSEKACAADAKFKITVFDPHFVCAGDRKDLELLDNEEFSGFHAWGDRQEGTELTSLKAVIAAIAPRQKGPGWLALWHSTDFKDESVGNLCEYYMYAREPKHIAPSRRSVDVPAAEDAAAELEARSLKSDASTINRVTQLDFGHLSIRQAPKLRGVAGEMRKALAREVPGGYDEDKRESVGRNWVAMACDTSKQARLPTFEFVTNMYADGAVPVPWPESGFSPIAFDPDWPPPLKAALEELGAATRDKLRAVTTVWHCCEAVFGAAALQPKAPDASALKQHKANMAAVAKHFQEQAVKPPRDTYRVAQDACKVAGTSEYMAGGTKKRFSAWRTWYSEQRTGSTACWREWAKTSQEESAAWHERHLPKGDAIDVRILDDNPTA
eukprot:g6095.t1